MGDMNNIWRHGDVVLHPIKSAEGNIIKHSGSFVLALGEATGHHHTITVADPVDMEIRETPAGFILVLKTEGTLTHQEHGPLTIAPGIYKVGAEREMDWFALKVTRVID